MSDSPELSREELLALLDVAGELTGEIDQDRLIESILEKACRMTGSPDGSVLLLDAERGGLHFAAACGEKGPELLEKFGERSNQRVPLAGSKAGEAFTSGQIVESVDLADDSRHFKGVDEQVRAISRSLVSVPMQIGGKCIGVLQILNKKSAAGRLTPYNRRDCALLAHLGKFAAVDIGNARLLAKVTAHMGLYSRAGAKDLADRIDQPATRETVTLLFADLRGFTQLCQSQAVPALTQEITNDLLTMLADQVLRRGGIVNKFLGDSVFAIFRCQAAEKMSVRCAFDMSDRFDSLRRRWDEICNEDLSFLDLGVGIATGPVTLGTFGSAAVRDFTAIGTAVNLACAFESAARNGRRVLVDNTTWNAVHEIVDDFDGPAPFELEKPGQVVIKYRHFHIKRLVPDTPLRVFISHNHRDREFVESKIREPLARRGIECWYSNADIIPGEKYVQAIEAGLLNCDWMIVLVSSNSVDSDWVKAEARTALADPRFHNRVLPLIVSAEKPTPISDALGALHSLDARNAADIGLLLAEFPSKREAELRAKLPKGKKSRAKGKPGA